MNDGALINRGEELSSRNVGGVGFVVQPAVVHVVDSHEIFSPRFVILRPRRTHVKALFIVNCYSPHSAADEVELDAFYDQLEEIIHDEKSFYKLVVGDFNARLGEAQEEEFRIGKLGMRDRNENFNRLTGLLSAARPFHGNSFFQKKEHCRWTRQSPDGTTLAELDHRQNINKQKVVLTRCWCGTIFLQWFRSSTPLR
nr:Endonuclease exonuclease phosphatase domain containing protein [Haemonchus contortus]